MQEEVTQKTVTFCVRATKITADLLKKVLVAYLRHQKQKSVEKKAQKNQPKQGKVTVKELAKQNAGMVNIEITDKNIKSFERYARKYGINYALKKDRLTGNQVLHLYEFFCPFFFSLIFSTTIDGNTHFKYSAVNTLMGSI